ncbi:MAG: hypothetical protein OHK0029_42670 [Armatimonadaceae bacterium]
MIIIAKTIILTLLIFFIMNLLLLRREISNWVQLFCLVSLYALMAVATYLWLPEWLPEREQRGYLRASMLAAAVVATIATRIWAENR